jgi:hypothetical protein
MASHAPISSFINIKNYRLWKRTLYHEK